MEEVWSILRPLLLEIVLPAVAASAATLLLLVWITRRFQCVKAVEVWIAPLAIAAGLAAGNFQRHDLPYWSLDHDYNSLIPATFAILLSAALGESLRESNRANLAIIAHVIGALIAAVWLTPLDAPGSRWLWVGFLFVAFRANYHALSGAWNDATGRLSLLLIAKLWCGAMAICLLAFIHTMRFFDIAALMASALLGAGAITLFTNTCARAALAAPAALVPALMLSANLSYYGEVPHATFLLLGIAPCALLLALPELSTRMGMWSNKARLISVMLLLLIPVIAAVGMAAVNDNAEEEVTVEQLEKANAK